VRTAQKTSLRHRLYHGETSFDFIGRKWLWFAVSGVIILAGVGSMLAQGLNFGIDFKGGVSWEVKARNGVKVSVPQTRDALRPMGLAEAKIQVARTQGGENLLRVEFKHFPGCGDFTKITEAQKQQCLDRQGKVSDKLASLAKASGRGQVSVNDVGPSWGKAITNKARNALIAFFVLITIYISARFEWKMAMAAIGAVVHDIVVTVGVYSISQFEVTPATVVAFLTILGYSLYDTIVVFDKVQENTRGLASSGRMTYSDTVNLSMNQVLMRSLNTSLVAILPILSVLVIGAYGLGATTLQDFGLALLVGLLTGAYSSIFIASPILASLKEREPRYANIRQRLLSKGGAPAPLTPAAAAAMGGVSNAGGGGRRGKADRSARGEGEGRELLVPAGERRSGGSTSPTAGTGSPRPRPSGKGSSGKPPPRPRKKGKRR